MVTRASQQNQIQEKILNAAAELFYEKGLQAVGVDEIVLQAGIAKMTLYKYFISKDQLILAVMQRNEEQWWDWFTTQLRKRSKVPARQILIVFDILADCFAQESYKGEPFIKARICVAERMYPIFLTSESFQSRLRELIFDIATLAKVPRAIQLADQFILLIMGANILANIETSQQNKEAIRTAKKIATILIKSRQTTNTTQEKLTEVSG